MIQLENIVTLDNGQDYVILEEVEYEGARFVYTVRVENQEDLTDDSMIFEAVNENGEEFLAPVEDKEVYNELIELFKDKVADKLDSINFDEIATQ